MRDPEQRDPDRRIRQALRRLLHRLQRPHPADARRRPGQRDRRLRLRRARRRRQGDDPVGRGRLPPQRDSLGAVRTGAVGLPGHGRVPRPDRHRLDEPEPRHRGEDHPSRCWSWKTSSFRRHEAADHDRSALPRRGAVRPRRCADLRRADVRGDGRVGPQVARHRRGRGGILLEPAVPAGVEVRRSRRSLRRLHRRRRG